MIFWVSSVTQITLGCLQIELNQLYTSDDIKIIYFSFVPWLFYFFSC